MAGGSWGIGFRRSRGRKSYYKVICPICNEPSSLTKNQYLNQLRFRCVTCQALRPIPEASEKVRY